MRSTPSNPPGLGAAGSPWLSGRALLLGGLAVAAAAAAVAWRGGRRLERQQEYSRRLEREVRRRTDELESQNRELAALNRRLQEVSVTDSLTGLWNRRYLANEIPKDLALIRRARIESQHRSAGASGAPEPNLLFLLMDLDGLKRVNDTYGHAAGDRAIVQMKELLIRVCRQSDTLIRWGGDEFLLLGRQTDRQTAATLADRVRHAVEAHRFDLGDGDTARLSCSIGFSFFPFTAHAPDLFTWEQVLDLADRGLYRAKRDRNRWVGVLSVPDADPMTIMRHKDGDLDDLARHGIIELQARPGAPPPEDDASGTATPRLVSRTG